MLPREPRVKARAIHQFQRPEPAKRIVEAAAIRFISGAGRQFFFGQSRGINFGESL